MPTVDLTVSGPRATEWLQQACDKVYLDTNGGWSFHTNMRTNHREVTFRLDVEDGNAQTDLVITDRIHCTSNADTQDFPLTDLVGPLLFFGTRRTQYPDLRPVKTWEPTGCDMNTCLPPTWARAS